MVLYLFNWFGLEGQGNAYQVDGPATTTTWQKGVFGEYGAFVEISLLRFTGGMFQERWIGGSEDAPASLGRRGYVSGVSLHL